MRVELLGAPRLVIAGTTHLLERKDAAMLAILALDGAEARGRVTAMLWPEADAEKARNNLRQRLFRLRRLAGRDLVSSGDTLLLAQDVQHDLGDAPVEAGDRAELLGTLDYDDCGALADWVADARTRWRKRRRAELVQRADRLEKSGRIAMALEQAERLVAEDPLDEDSAQRVMRLHAQRGDRAAALAAYRKLADTLASQLGTQPGAATRALAATISGGAAVQGDGAHRPRPAAVLRPPRLIGRQGEWSLLAQSWNAGRCTALLGEPGIGKSRLLGDFAAVHADAVACAARAGDRAIAYALLARVVHAVVARFGAPETAWVRAELARFSPELGPANRNATDPVRLVQALVQLVEHARGAGLSGLVLDDAQYADDASLETLLALVGHEGLRGLRLIVGVRAGEEPRTLREWRALGAAGEVRLLPLARAEIAELLASLDLPGFDPAAWSEPLFRHTGGNPLFVLETLRVALASDSPSRAELPATGPVGELIARRLAQLPAAALALAQVAALAGQDFSAELASSVLGKHALDIADAWRELEAAQILRDDAFAHDLILEATQRTVPPATAVQWHRSIGAYLELHGAPAARVAEHWYRSAEWQNAARQFDAAARAQFNASRYLEAGALFQVAAECFDRAGAQAERHAALQELAGCQIKAFDLSGARAVAQQLERIATSEEERGWALDRLADILNMSREDDGAAQAAAFEMQQRGRATGKPWMIFNATRKLAVALAHQGQAEAALALFHTQDAWLDANLHEWNVHVWFSDHGYVLDLSDRRTEAVAAYLRAEMLARQHENWAVAYAALRNLAFTHAWAGRLDTAVRTSDQAAAFTGRLGEALVERNPRDAARRGALLRDAGRMSEALHLLCGAHATLARGGSPYWLGYCEDQLALLYVLLGQPARARELIAADVAGLPPEATLSRWIVRSCVARAEGHPPVPWSEAQERAARHAACPPRWRLLATLERSRTLDTAPAIEACTEVAGRAGTLELTGIELAALALAAGRAAAANLTAVAGDLAQRAHRQAETIAPTGLSAAELCLNIHRGLVWRGDVLEAATALDRARHWIDAQALPNVPAEFRDSFLSRNPAHRALKTGLLTAARR